MEYGALPVAALLHVLPYRAALAVAWGFAAIAFHLVRFRRRETARRIREVFGDTMSDRGAPDRWLSLRNMAFNIVEMMRAPRIDRVWIDRHIPPFRDQSARCKS